MTYSSTITTMTTILRFQYAISSGAIKERCRRVGTARFNFDSIDNALNGGLIRGNDNDLSITYS